MNFQDFLEYVPKLIEEELPASEAHFKMAPLERIDSYKNIDIQSKNPKIAAVMMLFYPKHGKTHLVLIVRNSYTGVHSAQIAFPGGKYETEDPDFRSTALRETHEEIGIHPDNVEVLMPFTQLYIPPSNFIVYPFLGICREEVTFVPDANEVASIIELPLTDFLSDDLVVSVEIGTSYAENTIMPAFKIKEHIVWGATAMMLSELKDVLKKVL
jgi:8-oxo-dGTP pyrophosphatase MutT (NUDIX family)